MSKGPIPLRLIRTRAERTYSITAWEVYAALAILCELGFLSGWLL